MSNTPQVGTTEGNAADDILMVDQGIPFPLSIGMNWDMFAKEDNQRES
jgi:hypothetical protein